MATLGPGDHPWRVRVHGLESGAGVLLDERHVLTCAHVMGQETGTARVEAAAGFQDWTSGALVMPGTWGRWDGDTLRGDVTLLELDRPAPSGAAARLWCAPLSRGKVRVSGYPRSAPGGMPVDAELGGDGGDGLVLLKPVSPDWPWVAPGFSGAGVVRLGGEHAGHVIGIVVGSYKNEREGSRAAWMMPAETIRYHLPAIRPWVAGECGDQLGPASEELPFLPGSDTLRVALTRLLADLLTSNWAGTVVIPGGDTTVTGTAWLVRLVRTADPATRARASDAGLAGAPQGTSLPLGAIDAAYDARGKSADDVTNYLSERFGLPADRADLADRLLRRDPSVSLVIANVDQANSPGDLIRDLVRPLAAGARLHGARLVLGFAGAPPSPRRLPHEVLLDPGPPSVGAGGIVTAAEAEERVAELDAAEKAAADQNRKNERRFLTWPPLPPARSQWLRAWLAAESKGEAGADAAAIAGEAEQALDALDTFDRRSDRLDEDLATLRGRLAANRVRAERHFEAEDERLGALYSRALAALFDEPFDLSAARDLVQEYVAEVDRRLDGGQLDG